MEQFLPNDCLNVVLGFLDQITLESVALVCKRWLTFSRADDPEFEDGFGDKLTAHIYRSGLCDIMFFGEAYYEDWTRFTDTIIPRNGFTMACSIAGAKSGGPLRARISLKCEDELTKCYGFWCVADNAPILKAAFKAASLTPRTLYHAFVFCM